LGTVYTRLASRVSRLKVGKRSVGSIEDGQQGTQMSQSIKRSNLRWRELEEACRRLNVSLVRRVAQADVASPKS